MDLQLRNSIYQCNPRCSIEKRNTKNHSTSAIAVTPTNMNGNATAAPPISATPSSIPARDRDRPFRPPHDYTSALFNKIERDCTDKHELHRNNCLNETVSKILHILKKTFLPFYLSFSLGYDLSVSHPCNVYYEVSRVFAVQK